MGFLEARIEVVTEEYRTVTKKIMEIEGVAAISTVNYRYAENIKHLLEALILALQHGISDDETKSEEYFTKTHNRLELWLGDACQHVAGKKLKDPSQRILGSWIDNKKQIDPLYEKARHFWTQGRSKRKSDSPSSANDFLEVVKICDEILSTVKPITKVQWMNFVLTILGLLVGLSGWTAYFLK